jgi:hypothetical protein
MGLQRQSEHDSSDLRDTWIAAVRAFHLNRELHQTRSATPEGAYATEAARECNQWFTDVGA